MDLVEKRDIYSLHADCSGVSKDDVLIHIDGNVLHVSVTKLKMHDPSQGDVFHFKERSTGSVERSITLPLNADCDSATVKLENGQLNIAIPVIVSFYLITVCMF